MARLRVEEGAFIRQAKPQLQKAADLSKSATSLEEKGNKLRMQSSLRDLFYSKAVQRLRLPDVRLTGAWIPVTERGERELCGL